MRGPIDRALAGEATLLLVTADDVADASAVLHTCLDDLRERSVSVTCVTGLSWEKDDAGGVLRRLGLDEGEATLGLGAGPRVIVVDEADDADVASLRALSSAVHRLGTAPVLVILTASMAQTRSGGLAQIVRAHRRGLVRLTGLDGQGVQEIATRMGLALDENTAIRLAKHTDGSAAAVTELLQSHDSSQWRAPDTPLPPTVGALLAVEAAWEERPAVRPLVEACAAIGRWCVLEDAAAVADVAEGAGELLDQAVEAEVLVTRRHGLRVMIGFRSRLLRAAAYEAAGVVRQRELHRRAAEVLSDPGMRLDQRALASTGPDESLALELEQFADRCGEAGAWQQASNAYLAASRVSASRADSTRRLTSALDATVSDGYLLAARALMGELGAGERSSLHDAVLGYFQLMLGHKDEAEMALSKAWAGAEDDDALTRSSVAHRRTLHALVDWDSDELVRWGRCAIDLTEGAVPSIPAGFEAHTMLGLGLGGDGRTAEAEDVYQTLTSSVGEGAQGQRALMGQGWLHLALDRVPLAAHELELAAPMTLWRGSTRISLWSLGWLAHARLALGDLKAAQAAVDRALPLLQETGQAITLPLIHWAGAQIATLRGDTDRATWHAAAASAVRADYQTMLVASTMARACVAVGSGDYAAVVRSFEPLVTMERHRSIDEPGFWPWQDFYALALVAVGELDAADQFLTPHEELASQRRHRSTMARLGSVRGLLQFGRGDVDGGREAFDRALADISDLPLLLLRARIHLNHGQSLRRAGKRRDAEEELHHARQLFATMGADGYVARCDRELKVGARSREGGAVTELTAQERAVADHVVRGLTNKEVAEAMFISVKTVQYHLTRIYARLQIRSRSELTALWHSQ